jgi:hypothetical protein
MTEETIEKPPEEKPATTTETATETKVEPPAEKPLETKVEELPKKEEGKWYIDVITGLRHNVRETKEEVEALKKENAELKAGKKVEQLPDAEIQRRAEQLAATSRFNEQCNKIAEKGKESFAGFDTALANLNAVGALGANSNPTFLQTVAELPEAHKLLYHLGNNPDEAARINSLPPLKMAIELAKIETKIALPQTKQTSKAPPPITPVTGTGGANNDLASPELSMEEFSRIRAKQREERYKRS